MEDMEQAMTDVLVIEDPVEVTYRGYRLYSMPLPSSGGVILGEILNIMENVTSLPWSTTLPSTSTCSARP